MEEKFKFLQTCRVRETSPKNTFLTLKILSHLVTSIEGKVLNLTNIHRVHMGTYECIASNGISPDAVYEFPVEVHCKIFNLKFIEKCFN